jgi:predicted PurR-regulated permease PerM
MPPVRANDLIEGVLPIAILVILFLVAYTTLQPFLPAIIWGIILSVSLRPFHDRMTRRFGNRRMLATLFITLLMTLILILPILGLSRALLAFIPDAISWVSETSAPTLTPSGEISRPGTDLQSKAIAYWTEALGDLQYIRQHFSAELKPVLFWVIGEGRLVGTFVIEFALGVLLAAILLHRAQSLGMAMEGFLARIGGSFGRDIVSKSVQTIRSTVFGVVGSAAAQAAVASFAYYLAGAPHWPILSLLTFILGLIQIGPMLIWIPVAIWLWVNGQTGMSLFMAGWGLIVVGLTDNVVKTLVVSRGADLPAILAFLGAIGGLLTWGIVGLFLGPVMVAVCYQVMLQWLHHEAEIMEGD